MYTTVIAEFPYRTTVRTLSKKDSYKLFHVKNYPRIETIIFGKSNIIYPMAEICFAKDLNFSTSDEDQNKKALKLVQKIKRMGLKWKNKKKPQFFYMFNNACFKPMEGACVYENIEGLIKFFERDYIPGKLLGYLYKTPTNTWGIKRIN